MCLAKKDHEVRTLTFAVTAVISQTLVKKVGGRRVAAHEIMLATPAIRNLIRENKVAQMLRQSRPAGRLACRRWRWAWNG